MTDVFISYKREQRELVFRINERLRDLKLNTWFDGSLESGGSFSQQITQRIREAGAVVVCWSPGAAKSDWVVAEAQEGHRRKVLCPVLVEDCNANDIPLPFNALHTLDLRDWDGTSSHPSWQHLLDALSRILNRDDIAEFNRAIAGEDIRRLLEWRQASRDSRLGVAADQAIATRELARLSREFSARQAELIAASPAKALLTRRSAEIGERMRVWHADPASARLAARLSSDGPKRLLCIDGSLSRGMFSLGVLSVLETELRRRHRRPTLVLGDYFDLIGGCSLSSAIVLALGLGWTVEDTAKMYRELVRASTRQPLLSFAVMTEKFSSRRKGKALARLLPDLRLDSPEFRTGVVVFADRIDQGVVWPFANHPTYLGPTYRVALPLSELVMACSASPFLFKDRQIDVPGGGRGTFIDISSSKGADLSLDLLMHSINGDAGLGWQTGAGNLSLLSVGSFARGSSGLYQEYKRSWASNRAALALYAGRREVAETNIALLQTIGATSRRWALDTYPAQTADLKVYADALLDYQRINLRLEDNGRNEDNASRLKGRALTSREIEMLASDWSVSSKTLDEIFTLGRLCGTTFISPSYPRPEFDLSVD